MKALLRKLFKRATKPAAPPSDIDRARQLITAIDAGGIPLDTAIINRIAESFGLEVPKSAPVAETINRIRAALKRCDG